MLYDLNKSFYEQSSIFKYILYYIEIIKVVECRPIEGAGQIDNLKNEKSEDIVFDLNLIKRNELNINLIYFDLNITNKENYDHYNNFKIDVVGGI